MKKPVLLFAIFAIFVACGESEEPQPENPIEDTTEVEPPPAQPTKTWRVVSFDDLLIMGPLTDVWYSGEIEIEFEFDKCDPEVSGSFFNTLEHFQKVYIKDGYECTDTVETIVFRSNGKGIAQDEIYTDTLNLVDQHGFSEQLVINYTFI